MLPPPDTHPVSGGEWHPHIIKHDIRDDGTVLVTWALPGLTRAVVRVPLASWLDGHHQPTGRFLAGFSPIGSPRGTGDKPDDHGTPRH